MEQKIFRVKCVIFSKQKQSVVASEISQKFVYNMATRGMLFCFATNVNAITVSQIRQLHDKVRSHMIMKLKSDWKLHIKKRRASHNLINNDVHCVGPHVS